MDWAVDEFLSEMHHLSPPSTCGFEASIELNCQNQYPTFGESEFIKESVENRSLGTNETEDGFTSNFHCHQPGYTFDPSFKYMKELDDFLKKTVEEEGTDIMNAANKVPDVLIPLQVEASETFESETESCVQLLPPPIEYQDHNDESENVQQGSELLQTQILLQGLQPIHPQFKASTTEPNYVMDKSFELIDKPDNYVNLSNMPWQIQSSVDSALNNIHSPATDTVIHIPDHASYILNEESPSLLAPGLSECFPNLDSSFTVHQQTISKDIIKSTSKYSSLISSLLKPVEIESVPTIDLNEFKEWPQLIKSPACKTDQLNDNAFNEYGPKSNQNIWKCQPNESAIINSTEQGSRENNDDKATVNEEIYTSTYGCTSDKMPTFLFPSWCSLTFTTSTTTMTPALNSHSRNPNINMDCTNKNTTLNSNNNTSSKMASTSVDLDDVVAQLGILTPCSPSTSSIPFEISTPPQPPPPLMLSVCPNFDTFNTQPPRVPQLKKEQLEHELDSGIDSIDSFSPNDISPACSPPSSLFSTTAIATDAAIGSITSSTLKSSHSHSTLKSPPYSRRISLSRSIHKSPSVLSTLLSAKPLVTKSSTTTNLLTSILGSGCETKSITTKTVSKNHLSSNNACSSSVSLVSLINNHSTMLAINPKNLNLSNGSSKSTDGIDMLNSTPLSFADIFDDNIPIRSALEDLDVKTNKNIQISEPVSDGSFRKRSLDLANLNKNSTTAEDFEDEIGQSKRKFIPVWDKDLSIKLQQLDSVLGQSFTSSKRMHNISESVVLDPASTTTTTTTDVVSGNKKTYSCPHCHLRFDTCGIRNAHTRKVHERTYLCVTCDTAFGSAQKLERHLKTHSAIKEFKCETCNKEFMIERNLKLHYKLHIGQKDFSCNICRRAYYTKSGLQAHLRQNHVNGVHASFSCVHCSAKFPTKNDLVTHRKIHGDLLPEKCSVCVMEFRNSTELRQHNMLAHSNRQFSCGQCPHRSKTRDKLERHMMIHNIKDTYRCKHCAKEFVFKNSMIKHQGKGRCLVLKAAKNATATATMEDTVKQIQDDSVVIM